MSQNNYSFFENNEFRNEGLDELNIELTNAVTEVFTHAEKAEEQNIVLKQSIEKLKQDVSLLSIDKEQLQEKLKKANKQAGDLKKIYLSLTDNFSFLKTLIDLKDKQIELATESQGFLQSKVDKFGASIIELEKEVFNNIDQNLITDYIEVDYSLEDEYGEPNVENDLMGLVDDKFYDSKNLDLI